MSHGLLAREASALFARSQFWLTPRTCHYRCLRGGLTRIYVDLSFAYAHIHTVDGWNPAPPEIYKQFVNNGIFTISTGAGFLPSTVWQGFYIYQYDDWGFGTPCSCGLKVLEVSHLQLVVSTQKNISQSGFFPTGVKTKKHHHLVKNKSPALVPPLYGCFQR